jgi:hypothetical protein
MVMMMMTTNIPGILKIIRNDYLIQGYYSFEIYTITLYIITHNRDLAHYRVGVN